MDRLSSTRWAGVDPTPGDVLVEFAELGLTELLHRSPGKIRGTGPAGEGECFDALRRSANSDGEDT